MPRKSTKITNNIKDTKMTDEPKTTKTTKTTKATKATKAAKTTKTTKTNSASDTIINDRIVCLYCGKPRKDSEFYGSESILYRAIGKIPYCKNCLNKIYKLYIKEYTEAGYSNPEQMAVERICMASDIYYDDKLFESALNQSRTIEDSSAIIFYFKTARLYQYRKKDYNATIRDRRMGIKNSIPIITKEPEQIEIEQNVINDNSENKSKIDKAIKFFGNGFSDEDYLFLQEQYEDWTTRHECETKSQEEVFKQICFTQLELLKATRLKQDTKNLNDTFLKQLEAAKLQPKQNKGDTTSDAQTFGTLIDKWENTRPLPEMDDEFKDVDKIGKYIDVFFKGHTCKMLNVKNAFSNLYSSEMKKYTVEKPEYNDEEDSEALFDNIFGGHDTISKDYESLNNSIDDSLDESFDE